MNNLFGIIIDIVVLACLYWYVFKPRWQKKSHEKFIVYTLFYIYLCGVAYFTLMPIIQHLIGIFGVYYRHFNAIPFIDVFQGYGNFMTEIVLNIIMTIPFGFFLPLINRKMTIWKVLLATILFSSGIECLQWLTSATRIADVTDVITNTIGGVIGYIIFYCIAKLLKITKRSNK